jgi:hypothetical protein
MLMRTSIDPARILRQARACVVLSSMVLVGPLFAGLGVSAKPSEAASMTSRPAQGPFDDDSRDCLEAVPAAVSASGTTDNGDRISLDVLVLLDGLTKARGIEVMSKAAQAYAPLRIKLKNTFRRVNFSSDGNHDRLFDERIKAVGGKRPKGTDVVYLLTGKDLFVIESNGERSYNLAGVAYCIGGVRYPDAAFAMGEGLSPWESYFNDATFSAKIAAHEIGHLMGAHHHYGNCAEGDRSTDGGGEPSLCTIMWSYTHEYRAMNFGALERGVIRGHAVRFASNP